MDIEEKKVTDVLHRSKEQRYAFDKIYKNHSSEIVHSKFYTDLLRNCSTIN